MKATFIFLLAFFLVSPVMVRASVNGPVYFMREEWGSVYDTRGNFIFTFPTGEVSVKGGEMLFMANGSFMPFTLEVRDNRALMSLDDVSMIFSVDFDIDANDIRLIRDDITVHLHVDQGLAHVYKNEVRTEHDLFTAPTIINNQIFVPVRSLAEIFGSSVGFTHELTRRNPVVWVDDFTDEWELDLEALKATLRQTLNILYNAIESASDDDWLAGIDSDFASIATAHIAKGIDNLTIDAYFGRYAVIHGLAVLLIIDMDGNVFVGEGISTEFTIYRADFESPHFFSRYFHS